MSSTGEGPVRVVVTEGATFEGRIVEEKEAELKEGRWKSPPVPLPVGSGSATFTVIARARSAITGVPEGVSEPRTFVVYTKAPAVTMEPLKSLSNETKPSFSGATNETTPVAVAIYKGPTTSGSEVTSISATPAGGRWKTPWSPPGQRAPAGSGPPRIEGLG